ncbi:MAG TPA: YHS domain-containing protein [Ktedonobacterales bacterium]|jgi:YHS domain-containing protein
MSATDAGGQNFDAADVSRQAEAAANTPGDQIVTDPVCGRKIDKRQAQYTANYLGQGQGWDTYYFDSEECKQLFESNPQQYVKSA